jgi:hypothetical protein
MYVVAYLCVFSKQLLRLLSAPAGKSCLAQFDCPSTRCLRHNLEFHIPLLDTGCTAHELQTQVSAVLKKKHIIMCLIHRKNWPQKELAKTLD